MQKIDPKLGICFHLLWPRLWRLRFTGCLFSYIGSPSIWPTNSFLSPILSSFFLIVVYHWFKVGETWLLCLFKIKTKKIKTNLCDIVRIADHLPFRIVNEPAVFDKGPWEDTSRRWTVPPKDLSGKDRRRTLVFDDIKFCIIDCSICYWWIQLILTIHIFCCNLFYLFINFSQSKAKGLKLNFSSWFMIWSWL